MKQDVLADEMRSELMEHAKTYKTSWIYLGQTLYTVWRDKTYYSWGHEKFEDYVVNELGMKKPLAMKLVKTYFFVEQEEPAYLKKEFSEAREASVVPSYESLDVLRLARKNKDLNREDYVSLRKSVFEKGKEASAVKKDLTAMIKERKQVDPDEERERRHQLSVKRFMSALKTFKSDMESLKVGDAKLAEEAEELLKKLEEKYF
jgi:hypothetical protein